jgi:hypothetical protein
MSFFVWNLFDDDFMDWMSDYCTIIDFSSYIGLIMEKLLRNTVAFFRIQIECNFFNRSFSY